MDSLRVIGKGGKGRVQYWEYRALTQRRAKRGVKRKKAKGSWGALRGRNQQTTLIIK